MANLPQMTGAPGRLPSLRSMKQLARARALEFNIISKFPMGYRNLEDLTNLPPHVLIPPSQNVFTNMSDRIQSRQGYTLDGSAAIVTNLYAIKSVFDYEMHTGSVRNLRAWNTNLEYRYVDSSGVVTWRTLFTGLSATNTINFANWWDSTNVMSVCLFVDGTSFIFDWSGGITTIASVTVNTITTNGALTWAQLGFYQTGTRKITINGVDYTYTGGDGTATLTGVIPDPTGLVAAGDIAHQTVRSTANAGGLPATFANQLIGVSRNQLHVGSLSDRSVYVSKVNDYTTYTFTAAARLIGEGALLTLDEIPTAIIPSTTSVFISTKNQWYETKFQLTTDNKAEMIFVERHKTTALQGAQSQDLTTKIKNAIAFISNEVIFNEFGPVKNIYQDLQMVNLSNSIKIDFDGYDFTNGQVVYDPKHYYILVSAPNNGVVLVYNLIKKYWEPPWLMPIAKFSFVNGNLYGHSYLVPETYKMFSGYNDNGNAINCIAAFAYNNSGNRAQQKDMNMFYSEGYISSNTTLTQVLKYDLGGFRGLTQYNITGTDNAILFQTTADGSIGKNPLGSNPLGSITDSQSNLPKFRVIKTFPRQNYYEFQVQFTSNDIDQQWEILAVGGNQNLANATNAPIRQ